METQPREALRRNRSFVLLSAAQGIRGMAFWLCWLGMLSLASFTFHASPGQSALVLGAVSLPHILFAPFTGQIVDRGNAKWILLGTFVWNIATAISLLFVTRVWHVYIVAFAWSTSGAIVWPSLGSLLKGLVGDKELTRANGVLNSVWEATLIVGPLLSAVLAAKVGVRAPMAVGAVLYGVGALVLIPMTFEPVRAAKPEAGRRIVELRQGLSLMLRLSDLRALAIWGAVCSAGFSVLISVEPVFIRDWLHGGSSMLGWMYSIGGIGATLGALSIGWLAFSRYELRSCAAGVAVAGVFFGLYVGIARWPHVLPLQAFIGAGFSIYQTLGQSLVQRRSPRTVVGRALAAKRAIEELAGLTGTVAAGAIASTLGARKTMIAAAGVVVAAALVLLRRAFLVGEPASHREMGGEEAEPAAMIIVGNDPVLDRAPALDPNP